MSVVLLPRISAALVDIQVSELRERAGSDTAADFAEVMPSGVTVAPTGGSPATPAELEALRRNMADLASQHGYPTAPSQAQQAGFDAACARLLAGHALLASAETLRNDVWAYLSIILFGPITAWRFPGLSADRFRGGPRNAFQRLWLRAECLDRGESSSARWDLLGALTEDAAVQIVERPAIAGDARLALAIAEAWNRCAERVGKSRMEPVMRTAVKAIRLASMVRRLDCLDDASLAAEMDAVFEAACREHEVKPRRLRALASALGVG
ncbi:DUF6339 family protein [uncultured Maricaulis sp.]|uniref:DUF6339 family protein n=1 Tax=uncultured Maricaulis sp. TaxID=174710 RepID=UPI002613ACD5|nr:DUF6339 family protein [uncultured Maricaulis sp.]